MLNILIMNKKAVKMQQIPITWLHIAVLLVALLGIILLSSYISYSWGASELHERMMTAPLIKQWRSELQQQQLQVARTKQEASVNIEALTQRLAQLQAHVLRLDALGERLLNIAHLDPDEFNFKDHPAQGGPLESIDVAIDAGNFFPLIEAISQKLDDQSQQLGILESLFQKGESVADAFVHGKPALTGWLSSYFGWRTDPFTGKRAWHSGIDYAAKSGTPVVATGSGVVTWAGPRHGYGNLVEIAHGNGYITRYAHNASILVAVGDLVKKGQHLAKMGQTGRATGPHVHYEVIKQGKHLDPIKYINRALPEK